ncbi:YggS family pyridoxal phosphate-dependent enzyme [Nocardioides sp. GY 10127]|uniref:YggS family pyridoxal phosphate-dependent enzyme n=1 Tax=Nocardioides sp. GY 10127 TaxID=2569762 RepID=UPI0010A841E5|nr:YggS family pyridoxal phosphate-dependent enzyme [Nocardioides sp. GY 10127]TIC80982.1 YggS family pyridoxal phosphate-dependent enzyme [Nocardioides sp. GY 10127]
MSARADELAADLDRVRQRLAAAEAAAGREPGSVRLVVVTKYFPASDVRLLAGLGVTDVGENRHPEARDKKAECEDLGLVWHYIGGLQSNKAGQVGAYADVVESLDRPKLVARLDRAAAERGRPLDVLLQVSLDGPGAGPGGSDGGRAGAEPDDLPALAAAVEAAEHLSLRGLMAVAPLGEDPATAFARLAALREPFVRDHPGATALSAGMSGDLEQAVAAGATHVRVGSAILGSRPATH